ncbi:hypothetical protein ACMXYX_18005 (plasmid) [Neptuniibacter sp. QD72_48]|uniref:hypothetical protein n=1 Tax=Neptuniibacter sp. QD72_48 TaxID=3398214 RepID=UPI0039F5B4BF
MDALLKEKDNQIAQLQRRVIELETALRIVSTSIGSVLTLRSIQPENSPELISESTEEQVQAEAEVSTAPSVETPPKRKTLESRLHVQLENYVVLVKRHNSPNFVLLPSEEFLPYYDALVAHNRTTLVRSLEAGGALKTRNYALLNAEYPDKVRFIPKAEYQGSLKAGLSLRDKWVFSLTKNEVIEVLTFQGLRSYLLLEDKSGELFQNVYQQLKDSTDYDMEPMYLEIGTLTFSPRRFQ